MQFCSIKNHGFNIPIYIYNRKIHLEKINNSLLNFTFDLQSVQIASFILDNYASQRTNQEKNVIESYLYFIIERKQRNKSSDHNSSSYSLSSFTLSFVQRKFDVYHKITL